MSKLLGDEIAATKEAYQDALAKVRIRVQTDEFERAEVAVRVLDYLAGCLARLVEAEASARVQSDDWEDDPS